MVSATEGKQFKRDLGSLRVCLCCIALNSVTREEPTKMFTFVQGFEGIGEQVCSWSWGIVF